MFLHYQLAAKELMISMTTTDATYN